MKDAEKIYNQLQAVITETLPSQVSETLQKRLKRADELEIALEEANKEIKQLEGIIEVKDEKIRSLEATIDKHDSLTSREQEVKAREEAVYKAELNQENNKLKYQLESETSKTDFAKSVALGLVRNTNYRKTVFDSDTVQTPGFVNQQGQWVPDNVKNTTKNYNENTSEE